MWIESRSSKFPAYLGLHRGSGLIRFTVLRPQKRKHLNTFVDLAIATDRQSSRQTTDIEIERLSIIRFIIYLVTFLFAQFDSNFLRTQLVYTTAGCHNNI